MRGRNELPNISKNKTTSHNNISRAIIGLADYSHFKQRLLSGLKTKPEEHTPMSKRSESRKLVSGGSPTNAFNQPNRSTTLNRIDLVMPEIEAA